MAKNNVDMSNLLDSKKNKPLSFSDFFKKSLSFVPLACPYDDIVDETNFKRSSEIKRDMVASGNIGAGERGIFDYQEGEQITKDNIISDVEIALRSGKLDKADVQKLRELADVEAVSTIRQKKESELLEQADKAQKNRTAKLDQQLGINQDL